jgi:hypothetical protein
LIINGIETKYQNYAARGTSSAKNSSSESTFDSFQQEIVNWEKKIKAAIDKEQENDRKGNIQMSEKHWRNLIKKVDIALGTSEDNIKVQEQEENKQLAAKNMTPKDTISVSSQTHKTDIQIFDPYQTSGYTDFLFVHRKKV